MPQLLFRKAFPIAAGTLSLIAQGILLIPTTLGIFLRYLSRGGSLAIGAGLFAISVFLFIFVMSSQFTEHPREWRANGLLLTTQVFTVIGIYCLSGGFASSERGAGFLFSGFVTILTTYGIFARTIAVSKSPLQRADEDKDLPLDFAFDTNVDALKEQIEISHTSANRRKTSQHTTHPAQRIKPATRSGTRPAGRGTTGSEYT